MRRPPPGSVAVIVSIRAPRVGAMTRSPAMPEPMPSFNPRPPRGGDQPFQQLPVLVTVSIRAPRVGAMGCMIYHE